MYWFFVAVLKSTLQQATGNVLAIAVQFSSINAFKPIRISLEPSNP